MWLPLLLALSAPVPATEPVAAPAAAPVAAPVPAPIAVLVAGAYRPDRIVVAAGQPSRLVFTRTTWDGCTAAVVFPTLGITRDLPTNQAIVVDLPALPAGDYPFHCPMHMIHGTLEVR